MGAGPLSQKIQAPAVKPSAALWHITHPYTAQDMEGAHTGGLTLVAVETRPL